MQKPISSPIPTARQSAKPRPAAYYEKDAQGNEIAAVKNEDGSMTVELTTAAGEKAVMTLQRDENVIRALDAEGNVVAQRELDK